MSNTIERFAIWSVRTVITIVLNALILLVVSWIMPRVSFLDTPLGPAWLQAVATAILIGLINLLLRPIVLWISRPLGFFLLFVVGFALNTAGIYLADWLLPGFEVEGFGTAFILSIVATAVNVILSSVLNIGDEDSYYRRRTLEKAAANPFPTTPEDGRNLVMVEISA